MSTMSMRMPAAWMILRHDEYDVDDISTSVAIMSLGGRQRGKHEMHR